MKKDWNERAEKNPYHYVSSFREDWNPESFYKWGEIQVEAVIDRFLKNQSFDPSEKSVLEIGCGAGRLSRALATRFKTVNAYDVSDSYIQMAKQMNSNVKNIAFRVNDGVSFPEIEKESIDFAFSGWTIQHMPTREVVISNIMEISRVLKPNGLYKIDPPTESTIGEKLAKTKIAKPIVPMLVKDKLKATATFAGFIFEEKDVTSILENAGLTVNVLTEEDGSERFYGTKIMKKWLYGIKKP